MNKTTDTIEYDRSKARTHKGFTLLEITTVMVISSMVVITALSIFHRVQKTSVKINDKLEVQDVSTEILQRIAQDLDTLAVPGADTTVTINNKIVNGYNKSQLIIENKIYDKTNKPQVYERIVWQADYDEQWDCLNLYRSHSGLNLEDRMLDAALAEKQNAGTALFIPVCFGMTFFQIVVPQQERAPLTKWTGKTLPPAVRVSISFEEETENLDGTFEVLEEDITTRNIAVDRTRKIRFQFVEKDFTPDDPNDFLDQDSDPNEPDPTTSDTEVSDDRTKQTDENRTDTR